MLQRIIISISKNSRARKLAQFDSCLAPTSDDTILEVGVTDVEYSDVDNYLIKHYPCVEKITALGVGNLGNFRLRYPAVKTISYDGRIFPFQDDEFCIAHSNAVIEHVGSTQNQKLFLSELIRVSQRGMFTTPNKFFPVEMHTRIPFLHWLPKSFFDSFLSLIGKHWATGSYMNLLSYRQLSDILSTIPGVSFRVLRNRFFLFSMTFTVIWEKPVTDERNALS